jgi:hypothetical protein
MSTKTPEAAQQSTPETRPAAAPSPAPAAAPQTPTIGRIVHYVTKSGQNRPAQVVREGEPGGRCNLVVTFDGDNDNDEPGKGHGSIHGWLPSVAYDAAGAPRTWHWPPLK